MNQNSTPFWVKTTAIFGFTAVAFGAFGAHGLKSKLSEYGMQIYQTGVLYHLIHATVLLALVQGNLNNWRKAAFCISWGIVLFSGSLYVLALTEIKKLGMITPIGGTLFLAGWFFIFSGSLKKTSMPPKDS